MPAVRYHAIPVYDPQTGGPLLEARGALGNIVAEATTTPLRLSKDESGAIPLPQPITITPGGYIPAHWNQDGFEQAVFVPLSGAWSTPISSPQGYRDAARTAAARADAAELAANTARAAAEDARDQAIAAAGGGGGSGIIGAPTRWPTTFPPSLHTHTPDQVGASAVGRALITAADAAAARAAIGAGTGSGTSSLTLGSSATQAAPGNHTHAALSIQFTPSGSVTATNVQEAVLQAAALGGTGTTTGPDVALRASTPGIVMQNANGTWPGDPGVAGGRPTGHPVVWWNRIVAGSTNDPAAMAVGDDLLEPR